MKKFLNIKFIGSVFSGIFAVLSIIFALISFIGLILASGIYLTLSALSFGYTSYVLFKSWKNTTVLNTTN